MISTLLLSVALSGLIAQTPVAAPLQAGTSTLVAAPNAAKHPVFSHLNLAKPDADKWSPSVWFVTRFSSTHAVAADRQRDVICSMVVIHPPSDLDPGLLLLPRETGALIRRIEPPCHSSDSGHPKQ
jgi:hypothetical protein